MSSNVSWTRWRMYLALVLICQTTQRVEGYPRASTETSQDTRNSSREMSISELIEKAYEKGELLRPEQWSQRTDDHLVTRSVERDISSQLHLNDDISSPGERRLLEANTDMSMRTDADEKIVFPTDERVSSRPTPSLAEACVKNLFCESVADYPRQLVNAAIARNATLRFLETVDPIPDIEERINGIEEEEQLCQSREQIVYPQTAQNKDKQTLFIVNQDNLKQGIRMEVCVNEGQECSFIQGFAEGYKTICKQKYIYRELVAVGNDGNIVRDSFRFPSSCCCHIKFIGSPTVRLGQGLNLRSSFNRTAIVPKTRWRK